MDPANRWVRMADRIPWDEFERRYAGLFESGAGNPAKPLRLALGCLIIQARYQYPDRELVEQLKENPYYQYFIGLPGYQEKAPIDASTLVLFRRRLTADILREANEYLLEKQDEEEEQDEGPPASGGSGGTGEEANSGTLILDATCSPVNIRYPQVFDLLYRTRDNRRFCKERGIRLSGPKLGRPSETAKQGLIVTKLEETQLTSIALSVFVVNLFKIQKRILSVIMHVYRFLDNKYTFYRNPCI